MGYTTDFCGEIELDKPLTKEDKDFLEKFAQSRRMQRNVCENKYGIQGEWFVDGDDSQHFGPGADLKNKDVLDYNSPPKTQPGLWCQWVPNSDGTCIEWDGNEKFYEAQHWMKYLIDGFLKPKGYKCNGTIQAQGEDISDRWRLIVKNNKVFYKAEDCTKEEVHCLEHPPIEITKLNPKEICGTCADKIKCQLKTR